MASLVFSWRLEEELWVSDGSEGVASPLFAGLSFFSVTIHGGDKFDGFLVRVPSVSVGDYGLYLRVSKAKGGSWVVSFRFLSG